MKKKIQKKFIKFFVSSSHFIFLHATFSKIWVRKGRCRLTEGKPRDKDVTLMDREKRDTEGGLRVKPQPNPISWVQLRKWI